MPAAASCRRPQNPGVASWEPQSMELLNPVGAFFSIPATSHRKISDAHHSQLPFTMLLRHDRCCLLDCKVARFGEHVCPQIQARTRLPSMPKGADERPLRRRANGADSN